MKILKKIYNFVSSMKFGLLLLVLIGVYCAIGSLFFEAIFFKTIVFQLLLFILLLNMVLCVISQLRSLSRKWQKKQQLGNEKILRAVWLLLIHAGILIILVGGTVDIYKGQTRTIVLQKGEEINISNVLNTSSDFALKLDSFEIEFNPDGSPAQYYSYLTILNEKEKAEQYEISVNSPLNYEGIKIYQQSFGYLIDGTAFLGSREEHRKLLREGEFLDIPETSLRIKIYKYIPDYDPNLGLNSKSLRPDNPVVVYSLYDSENLIEIGVAPLAEKIEIDPDNGAAFRFNSAEPFSVLKIKHSPGLLLVAAGALMLMAGVVMVLVQGSKT